MKLYKLILNKIKLFLLVVITLIPLKCFALVDATDKFYVNDYGKVLSQKDETFIYENSKKLYEKTKAQIVVVTVKDLEGQDVNSYADSLFEKFKIGTKEESYGLLILLSVNDRLIRVTTGSGTEEFLPDGKVGRIIDNSFIPYGKENKLDKGIMNLYKSLYNEMGNSLGYNGKLSVTVNKDRETSLENNSYNIFSSDKYIVKIIITLLVLSIKFKSNL